MKETTVEKELADQMGQQSILNGELFSWDCFLSVTQRLVWGSSSLLLFSQKHATANEICYYKVRGFANTKDLL